MARNERAEHIGFEGAGFDCELTEVRRTEKGVLVRTETGEEVWLPLSAFDDDGCLFKWGLDILEKKLEEGK